MKNEHRIINSIESESASEQYYVKEQLDYYVLSMGMFSWEIDSGKGNSWVFTISPNGNKELMNLSRDIIEEAPSLEHWQFAYYKQAREWDRIFKLYDSFMNLQEIDASTWRYIIRDKPGDEVDVSIIAKSLDYLDSETAQTAADFVVVKEVGEYNRIWKIDALEVLSTDDIRNKEESKEIGQLHGEFLDTAV